MSASETFADATLEDAARAAAAIGAEALPAAEAEVATVIDALARARDEARARQRALAATPAAGAFARILDVLAAAAADRAVELGHAVAARRATLDRLRIVAFGRTHVGKSTLIEAIVRGDGATVSDGRTGFTRDARVYPRPHLDVVDLPGIEAFGPDGTADEQVAEREVRAADVVLLVFDDNNQKITEFAKIAEWVSWYAKPAVVVLNVKSYWRRGDVLVTPHHRRRAQVAVEQQAAHVRRRLAEVGMADVTVLALGAQTALFARGAEPPPGHLLHTARARLRTQFGPDGLRHISNFDRFERYLLELVRRGGPELRLAALNGEVAGSARRARATLEEAGAGAETLARDVLLPQVDAVLRLVGTERVPARTLEKLRSASGRGDFGSGAGEIVRHAADLAVAHVDALERKGLAQARSIAETEVKLTKEACAERLLPRAEAAAALATIDTELRAFIRGRLDSVKAEIDSDLQSILEGKGTSGQGGALLRAAGLAAGALAIIGGIATFFAGLATLPALGAAAALFGLAGLGGWLRKKAEARRAEARRKQMLDLEGWVRAACGRLRGRVDAHADALAKEVAANLATPLTAGYLALHGVAETTARERTRVMAVAARRGRPSRVGAAAQAAREAVLRATPCPKGADPAAWTLLGGDWVGEPVAGAAVPEPPPNPLLARLPPLPAAPSAPAWLDGVHPLDQEALAPDLARADALARATRRRVVLAGEYNATKSSLLLRLLVAEGLAVPPSLTVAAHPETDRAHVYAFGQGVEVVDTPGTGSGTEGHDERALAEAAAAPCGAWCLTPALFTGAERLPAAILAGSTEVGTAPGAGRWSVLVTRADAMGTSPADDPRGWAGLRDKKRGEVGARLTGWGAGALPIAFVSADPFQRVGGRADATRADFAGTDAWDGFAEFHAALAESLARQTTADRVVAAGRSLGPALARRRDSLRADVARLGARARLDDSILRILEQCRDILDGKAATVEQRVRSAVDAEAGPARAAILGAADAAALKDALEAHSRWPAAVPARIQALDRQLQKEAEEAIEWANSKISRRLDSPSARQATEGLENRRGTREAPEDGRKARSWSGLARVGGNLAEKAAEKLALDPKLLREELKLALGSMKKWKPWEATKLAEKLGTWGPRVAKLGKALGAIAVVLEVAAMVIEEKRRRDFEKLKVESLAHLNALVDTVTAEIVAPADGTGLRDALAAVARGVDAERERLVAAAEDARADAAEFEARAAALDHALQRCLTG